MGFDTKRFLQTKFSPRKEDVALPDLKDFFDEGTTPVFQVRGLTGHELAEAKDEARRNRDIATYLEGLVSPEQQERIASMRAVLGLDGKVTNDLAERLALLRLGSVDPKVDFELAAKLCETFPIEFYGITNTIYQLTGAGHVPGKAEPSGEMNQ